jgi:hypothetical protein
MENARTDRLYVEVLDKGLQVWRPVAVALALETGGDGPKTKEEQMTLNVFRIPVVMCIVLLLGTQVQGQKRTIPEAFSFVENKIILATTTSDGKKLSLMLDTGSNRSVLLSKTARDTSNGENPVTSGQLPLPRFVANGIPFDKMTFLVEDLPALLQWNRNHPERPIDGLLGADALQQKILGLDFVNMSISAWQADKLSSDEIQQYLFDNKPELAHWTNRIPLHLDAASGRFSLSAKLDSRSESFLLDTGSVATLVNAKVGKLLDPLVEPVQVTMRELDAQVLSTVTYIRSLGLGSLVISYPTILISPKPTENVIGINSFVDRKCIFDFKNRQIYLSAQPTENERNQAILPSIGVFASSRDNKYYALVQKHSSADKAGIETNDEILDVSMEDTNTSNIKTAVFTLMKHGTQSKTMIRVQVVFPNDRPLAIPPQNVTIHPAHPGATLWSLFA